MSNAYSKIFEWSQKLDLNCLALLLWVSSWVSCLVLSQTKPSLSSAGALSKFEDLLMRISHFVPSSSPITPCVSCAPLCSPGWELPSQHANHLPCLQNLFSAHIAAGKLGSFDQSLRGGKKMWEKVKERRQSYIFYNLWQPWVLWLSPVAGRCSGQGLGLPRLGLPLLTARRNPNSRWHPASGGTSRAFQFVTKLAAALTPEWREVPMTLPRQKAVDDPGQAPLLLLGFCTTWADLGIWDANNSKLGLSLCIHTVPSRLKWLCVSRHSAGKN